MQARFSIRKQINYCLGMVIVEGCDNKEPQGNSWWGDMYDYFLDCGHKFTNINRYQCYQIIYIKCVALCMPTLL